MTNREGMYLYSRRFRRSIIITGVIIVFLTIQYVRQSWPFIKNRQADANGEIEKRDQAIDKNQHDRASVQVDTSIMRSLGIQIETVRIDTVAEPVRAVATVVPDESRISHIHTRVSGWLEKLYVNKTGQQVETGAPLAGIFSQELYASQMEYVAALDASRTGPQSAVVESARTRLKVFGMTDTQIRELERRGSANRLTTIVAPRSGIVMQLNVFAGMQVDPSLVLMTIADLSQVWILAEIPGTEEPGIEVGTNVVINITASGRRQIQTTVSFIYPALTEGTRTIRVRMVVKNPNVLLKPGAYGTAEFAVRPRVALTVARDAIVDQGQSQHVFVETSPGTFVPKQVSIGIEMSDRVEIVEGLSAGDPIVSSGVFLIDSESRLRTSGIVGGGHGGHGGTQQSPERTPQPSEPEPQPSPGDGHQGH